MEENTKSQRKHPVPHTLTHKMKMVSVVVVLVVALVGFFSGVQYQKGKKTTTAPDGQFQAMGGGGMMGQGGQKMGEAGTVTAVSSTSISINSQRTSSVVTYAINSSTTITDNGATVTTSDIAVGDMVLVESSGSSTAASIVVNPSPTGGPQMNSSSGATTQTN